MPSYKIAKFLVPRMNSITSNEVKIPEKDNSLVTGSLDFDLLFRNITFDKAIDICTNTIYSQPDVIEDINKEEFQNLLSLATKESYFTFIEVLYKIG